MSWGFVLDIFLVQTQKLRCVKSEFLTDSTHRAFNSKVVVYSYAVNDEPQPQLPVEFGFLNVNPEPITPET